MRDNKLNIIIWDSCVANAIIIGISINKAPNDKNTIPAVFIVKLNKKVIQIDFDSNIAK